jgi:hypothetical protein
VGQDEDGNPVIIVGLDAGRARQTTRLPHSIEGYPVITQVVGPVRAR